MSSGNASTTQTTGLSPEIAGILSGFGNAANSAMNMPYQQFNGPRVANLSGLQNQVMGNYGGMLNDSSWDQARNTYSDMQNGSMNPFLQQVRDTATADTTRAYNQATAGTRSSYNSPGNFGSARQNLAQDRNDTNLARGLSQGLAGINAQGFENVQNRRLQGAQGQQGLASTYSGVLGNAAQAGNMGRGFEQQVIDANYGDWNRANDYPWSQLERGAGIFGQLQGGAPRTTTTTGPGADRVSQGLGLWMLGNSMSNGKNASGTGVSG